MITLHENLAHEFWLRGEELYFFFTGLIHSRDKILKPYTKGQNIFLNLY